MRDEKVVAILGVGNKPDEYDEDDVKWIGIMADLAWDIVSKKIAEDEQKLLQALGQCQRNKMIAALMIFDLDKFKIVNDTLGQAIGDRNRITVFGDDPVV